MPQNSVDVVERELISGRARWVAELNEFFREHRIRETVFDLYARGRTRSRGFLMSRFFAWSVLPDYHVSLLCIDSSRLSPFTQETLRRTIDAALHLLREGDLHWVWLIVLVHNTLPGWAMSFVQKYDRQELGLAIASTTSHDVVVSKNQVGKSISKHLRLEGIMKKLES